MGNCKDCKWWKAYPCNTAGACDTIVMHSENITENEARIDASATDDSGLDAYLTTGPMFGCVQFKAKTGEGK